MSRTDKKNEGRAARQPAPGVAQPFDVDRPGDADHADQSGDADHSGQGDMTKIRPVKLDLHSDAISHWQDEPQPESAKPSRRR